MARVACTNCGQDWISKFVVVPTGRVFYMCPKCEWVWARLPEPGTDAGGGAGSGANEDDEELAMEVSSYVWEHVRRVDD